MDDLEWSATRLEDAVAALRAMGVFVKARDRDESIRVRPDTWARCRLIGEPYVERTEEN